MSLIVQKYGGTSVKDPERIRAVAERISRTRKEGHGVVVVVSAMAGETNRLLDLAHRLCKHPEQRELDVVLSSGEQVTSGLLSIALNSMGFPAVCFQGHQIKIMTDSVFNNARIEDIKSERIVNYIKDGKVVVVAGFQGINDQGDITTLGRGGSDISAIALAHSLKADVCEIYTDVDGVFTADPRICPKARKMDKISYEEMLEMASQGAKVLQTRSVEMAAKYNVNVMVRNSYNDNPGTLVCEEEPEMEKAFVSGIAHNNNEAKISIRKVPDHPGIASKIFDQIAQARIVVDMIIQNISQDGFTDMTFTVPDADLEKSLETIQKISDDIGAEKVESDPNIAKISVIGVGMRSHTGIASIMFQALAKEEINIKLISTSEIKISCVIDLDQSAKAVCALHDAFGLEQKK